MSCLTILLYILYWYNAQTSTISLLCNKTQNGLFSSRLLVKAKRKPPRSIKKNQNKHFQQQYNLEY